MKRIRSALGDADLRVVDALLAGKGILAAKLFRATNGLATDEATIWRALEEAPEAEKALVRANKMLVFKVHMDLAGGEQLRFDRMLAGTYGAADRVEAALKGFGTDEAGLFQALASLEADDLAKLPKKIAKWIEFDLSGEDRTRALELLAGARRRAAGEAIPAGGLTPVARIKVACAGIGTDVDEIWRAISSLTREERALVRTTNPDKILDLLERELSGADFARVQVLLSDSNMHVTSLRAAGSGWGTDERLVYDTLDRALASGELTSLLAYPDTLAVLESELGKTKYRIVQMVLSTGTFTPTMRLAWATDGLGTDEALVLELCGQHGAEWWTGTAVDPEVDAILKRELSTSDYWAALDAIRPSPATEDERLARSKERLERERSGGLSRGSMDAISFTGKHADDAWREYQARFNDAIADGQLEAEELRLLRLDETFSDRLTREYAEAKATTAAWAADIAVAIVAITVSILTAGAGAAAFIAALGGQAAAVAEAMVVAAVAKVGLKKAIHGEGYDLGSVQTLVDATSAMVQVGLSALGSQVVSRIVQGGSKVEITRAVVTATQRGFGGAGTRIAQGGLEGAVDGTLGGLGEGVVQTMGTDSSWDGKFLENLGNIAPTTVGMSALSGAGMGALLRGLGEGWAKPKIKETLAESEVRSHERFLKAIPDEERPPYAKLEMAELRRIFPEKGPIPWSLEGFGKLPGFTAFAKASPKEMRILADAQNLFGDKVWDDIAELLELVQDPKMAWSNAARYWEGQLPQVTPHPSQKNYTVVSRGQHSPDTVPDVNLRPTPEFDHNGAFMQGASVPSESGPARVNSYVADYTVMRPDQLVVGGKPLQSMEGVFVFSGHGNRTGFKGMGTDKAAALCAAQIRAQAAKGSTIRHVVLDACHQRDGRWLLGDSNAEAFQGALRRELSMLGLSDSVHVLAASRPGPTYGYQQRTWLPWGKNDDGRFGWGHQFQDATFTDALGSQPYVKPSVAQAGALGAATIGGLAIYRAVSDAAPDEEPSTPAPQVASNDGAAR
jgi:hypothetical protein